MHMNSVCTVYFGREIYGHIRCFGREIYGYVRCFGREIYGHIRCFGREIYLRGGTKAQNQAFFGC
jgi:hypothetical protein